MKAPGLADMCLELWEILSSSWPSSALLVPLMEQLTAASSGTCCAADSGLWFFWGYWFSALTFSSSQHPLSCSAHRSSSNWQEVRWSLRQSCRQTKQPQVMSSSKFFAFSHKASTLLLANSSLEAGGSCGLQDAVISQWEQHQRRKWRWRRQEEQKTNNHLSCPPGAIVRHLSACQVFRWVSNMWTHTFCQHLVTLFVVKGAAESTTVCGRSDMLSPAAQF